MTIKGSDVIGLKVITLDTGEKVNTVTDIIFDPSANQVTALLIDEGGWFSEAKVILIQDVKAIGVDAVTIESSDLIKKASEAPQRVTNIAQDKNYLSQSRVITEEGTELGKISDIYFDEHTGKVLQLEVTQGILKDTTGGKKLVNTSDIITVGEYALIVKNYIEADMSSQAESQGLKGTFNTTMEKTKDSLGILKEKAQETGHNLSAKLETGTDKLKTSAESHDIKGTANNVKDTAADAVQKTKVTIQSFTQKIGSKVKDQRVQGALGKYVTVNLIRKNDSLLAPAGTMITHELINEAEKEDMIDNLLSNVSADPTAIA